MTPYARARVIDCYLAGDLTVKEIGHKFSVCSRTIERVVAAAGKSYSRQHRPLTKEEKAAIVAAYAGPTTVSAVARKFGVSLPSARYTLRASGVRIRPVREAMRFRHARSGAGW